MEYISVRIGISTPEYDISRKNGSGRITSTTVFLERMTSSGFALAKASPNIRFRLRSSHACFDQISETFRPKKVSLSPPKKRKAYHFVLLRVSRAALALSPSQDHRKSCRDGVGVLKATPESDTDPIFGPINPHRRRTQARLKLNTSCPEFRARTIARAYLRQHREHGLVQSNNRNQSAHPRPPASPREQTNWTWAQAPCKGYCTTKIPRIFFVLRDLKASIPEHARGRQKNIIAFH